GQLAFLIEKVAALFRNAFDTGFDRDTSRLAEKIEHLRLPEIDSCLDAELDLALNDAGEEFFVGQKNLIDKVKVSRACVDQTVHLLKHRRNGPLTIVGPEI